MLASDVLIGFRSELPEVCGLCSRQAWRVAIIERNATDSHLFWLCEICSGYPKNGMRAITMKPNEIEAVEAVALEAAAKECAGDLAGAMLGSIWMQSIRNLEAMNGENFKAVAANMAESPEFKLALRKMLLAYSNSVRLAVLKTTAPT